MPINKRPRKPLIGIMVNNPKPLPSYDYTKNLKIDLLVFRPNEIKWLKQEIYGYVLESKQWKKKSCPFPLAVYNQLYSSRYALVNKLEKAIGKGKVFNCITKFNKWDINKILRESEVRAYLPMTYLYHQNNVLELLEKYSRLILKPCLGACVRIGSPNNLAPLHSAMQTDFKL